jgi:hypothetical protein
VKQRGVSSVFIVVIGIVLLGAGVASYRLFFSNPTTTPNISPQSESTWKEIGSAIPGQYADADVVELGNGNFRMYYSVEPEVPGNKLEMYSSISTDGINWVKEAGIRKEFSTFPDVIKLPDGKFRLYFQNMGVIKSAISDDGLTWVDEPGVRIDKNESGFNLENVGAQSTTQLSDGTYIMVYRGAENKPYGTEKLPNQTTSLDFYAVSQDGLNFSKKGIAFDTRNNTLKGFADGAEWVKWDEEQLRVYFWSYRGIYHVTYQNGSFSKPEFDFSNDPDTQMPPSPPSDPTLTKINSTWFMYYGQHTKGIYYATLQ